MKDERHFIEVIATDATVISLVGLDSEGQVKIYQSPAPQRATPDLPLVTYFVVNASPNNKLKSAPDSRRYLIQLDIFDVAKSSTREIGDAVIAAGQSVAVVQGFRDIYEADIRAHRRSIDFSYFAT